MHGCILLPQRPGFCQRACFCRCRCRLSWLPQLLSIQSSAQDTRQTGQASANKGKARTRTRKHAHRAITSTTPALPLSRVFCSDARFWGRLHQHLDHEIVSCGWKCKGHSSGQARPRVRVYTMRNARPAGIARALASSATPPAGRARIRRRLLKLVISEATFAAPWHGRARPEQKHTPAKASCSGPFQAAAATWAAACPLSSPSHVTCIVPQFYMYIYIHIYIYICIYIYIHFFFWCFAASQLARQVQ